MNEYKVGYKKPPKEHQFKPKHQTAARPDGGKRKENSPDVAGWLDKPLAVKRGGKTIRMHPHEAAMISLGKKALKGEPRATKQFLKYCEIAGLLDPTFVEQIDGVFRIPPGVNPSVAKVMISTHGLPPWDRDEYATVNSDYKRDRAHVDELDAKFRKDLTNAKPS